jgi:hypothetical protein
VFVSVELTSTEKGAIAETAITAAATELAIGVYRPVAEGARADLLFDFGTEIHRVQCKWARLKSGVVEVRAITCRRGPTGYLRGTYGADEVDAIAAYCHPLRRCFYVPLERFAGAAHMFLRLTPPKNNQRVGIHSAEQYDLGAVAQLGERRTGSAKATGSSPVSSTSTATPLF